MRELTQFDSLNNNLHKKITMKKIIYTALTVFVSLQFLSAQNVLIPDANFKAYLVGNNAINTNGDTEIQTSEANSFGALINVAGLNISDLTGIEAFVGLGELVCFDNQLTSLDLTQNTSLVLLNCSDNQLTGLDLSQNGILQVLNCSVNQLTSLNVANGNNANLPAASFNATSNSNLTCIQVDDVNYSTNNWMAVDAGASFSLNCGGTILVNTISVFGQGGVVSIDTPGGTLQMETTVIPANADDTSYVWSVINSTGSATISPTGVLTAISDGVVAAVATANDASGMAGSTFITITNQQVGVDEMNNTNGIRLFPNPAHDVLYIDAKDFSIEQLEIIDLSGKVVRIVSEVSNIIPIDDLPSGVYSLKVHSKGGVSYKRFVKQ